MEIEINFRFDENGRTANTKIPGGTEISNRNELNYGFRATMTDLREWFGSSESAMDDILLDCEISDNLIMPRTYWMPADGQARCALEQFALDVFRHHVPSEGFDYDPETSGAEWWCQLRPSPETGRHRAVRSSCDDDHGDRENEDDPFANGISFHVDKDEELRILTGGSTYVHPHLSTITYLTDLGSPTLIMDCQVHPLTGEWMVPEESVEGFVSWPSVGKHTSFDGRYLHASPLDLMGEKDAFEKQLEAAAKRDDNESGTSKARKRRHRRVTFLVNIWLNYHPYDVHPFPESMIDKMSGRNQSQRRGLNFGTGSRNEPPTALHVQKTQVRSDTATEIGHSPDDDNTKLPPTTSYQAPTFTWPLGDKQSGETLQCRVPLTTIVKSGEKGGNVQIVWQKKKESSDDTESDNGDCFHLFDGKLNAMASPSTVAETKDESPPHKTISTEESSENDHTTISDTQGNKRPRIE